MGRYSYTAGNRVFILGIFAALVVGAIFIGVSVVTGSTETKAPPLWFAAIWVLAVAWNAYWWLWRMSYRVEVDGDRLIWKMPLRHGEARVQDVEAVRPWTLTRQVSVIALRDLPDIIVQTRRGLPEFAATLAEDRAVPVTISLPLGERAGFGGTGFERQD